MNTSIKTEVKKLPDSRVAITATIPVAVVESFRNKAIARLKETAEIDGFRKGHVPESAIIEKVGETGILTEMADMALLEHYPVIITESKIQPISRPEIALTKLATGNDVECVITTDVMPTVALPDVKKIAKEHNTSVEPVIVTDDDVTTAVTEIRQMRAHDKMHQDGVEHHDHNHQNIPEDQLPELNEEFVKSLGNFESVDDFMTKLRENIIKEKENQALEKKRVGMIESMITAGTFDIPGSMIDFELDKMLEQFKYDLAMSGMKFEDYLTHIGKTLAEIKTEWRDQAKKRVQTQLLLESVAKEFSIKPDEEKMNAYVAQVLEMYKDQAVEEENVRAYANQIHTNNAVFDWFDAQK